MKLHLLLPIAPHRSRYRLNHPSPTTPSVEELIVFHETSPWCQKGWGPLSDTIFLLLLGEFRSLKTL